MVSREIDKQFYSMPHESVGIVQNVDCETRPDLGCTYKLQNVEKSGFEQSVRVSVCLPVAFVASSHGRKG